MIVTIKKHFCCHEFMGAEKEKCFFYQQINIFTFLLAAKTSCAEKIPVTDVSTVRFEFLISHT